MTFVLSLLVASSVSDREVCFAEQPLPMQASLLVLFCFEGRMMATMVRIKCIQTCHSAPKLPHQDRLLAFWAMAFPRQAFLQTRRRRRKIESYSCSVRTCQCCRQLPPQRRCTNVEINAVAGRMPAEFRDVVGDLFVLQETHGDSNSYSVGCKTSAVFFQESEIARMSKGSGVTELGESNTHIHTRTHTHTHTRARARPVGTACEEKGASQQLHATV